MTPGRTTPARGLAGCREGMDPLYDLMVDGVRYHVEFYTDGGLRVSHAYSDGSLELAPCRGGALTFAGRTLAAGNDLTFFEPHPELWRVAPAVLRAEEVRLGLT